jgi:hypothetical protein
VLSRASQCRVALIAPLPSDRREAKWPSRGPSLPAGIDRQAQTQVKKSLPASLGIAPSRGREPRPVAPRIATHRDSTGAQQAGLEGRKCCPVLPGLMTPARRLEMEGDRRAIPKSAAPWQTRNKQEDRLVSESQVP